jgi:hypothetical protein
MSGQSWKNNVYSVNGDRAESQDHILKSDDVDPKRIRCTTEVVVESVEKDVRA